MIQFPTLSVMQKNRAAVAAELRRLLPKMEAFRTAKPLPIGVAAIDSHLPDGGLQGGALHEIVPEDGGTPAAIGFMVALLARVPRWLGRSSLSCPATASANMAGLTGMA